jgi:N utilization substance protein A
LADIKLDLQAIERIALFQSMTRVDASDCVETSQVAYFVVPRGSIGRLKDSPGLERLSKKLGKGVRLIEHRDEPEAFLKSLFWHYGVEKVSVEQGPHGLQGRVRISPLMKGRAIGKGGENLKALRELAKRHVGLDGIVLE